MDCPVLASTEDNDAEARWCNVPKALRTYRQWVVWQREPRGIDTTGQPRWAKVPYCPTSGKKASVDDEETWASFDEAIQAHARSKVWDGIGFVLTSLDPFVFVDLDKCRDAATGTLTEKAQRRIARLASYTEISPSGTGLHILLQARLPRKGKRKGHVEVYGSRHFVTVTGDHLPGTPNTIEERQATFDAWYAKVFGETLGDAEPEREGMGKGLTGRMSGTPLPDEDAEAALTPDDEALLHIAKQAANGPLFADLWEGQWQKQHYPSPSEADLALCALLAFWTNRDTVWMEHLFRHSGLYRPAKWTQHAGHGVTYGQSLLAKALRTVSEGYLGTIGTGRQLQPVHETTAHTLAYPWQEQEETAEERETELEAIRATIRHDVLAHLARGEDSVLVVAAPPGVGKSHAVAKLGLEEGRNLAWVAERKDMVEQVATLQQWHIIRAADADNCSDYLLHQELAKRGYNTWSVHQRHACAYKQQFGAHRSTVYQLPHVATCYPAQHRDGIIIDELNLTRWLNPLEPLTRTELEDAADSFSFYTGDKPAHSLLEGLAEVLREAKRNHVPRLAGWALFDALARACGGQRRFSTILETLFDDVLLRDARPRIDLSPAPRGYSDGEALAEVAARPRVVLPPLLDALEAEYPRWRRGQQESRNRTGPRKGHRHRAGQGIVQDRTQGTHERNSCLQIEPVSGAEAQRLRLHSHAYVLRILGPQCFARPWVDGNVMHEPDDTDEYGRSPLPPRVVLDATGDEALYERLFGVPVVVKQEPLNPPPHMRHVAVRLATPAGGIKRFGKTNMTKRDASYRERAVRQVRHVLRELELDDAAFSTCRSGQVGVITFKDCEDELRTALGIPEGRSGHFFAQRGSNALEECTVLLVVGTPAQPPDVIYRMACALWRDDDAVLNPEAGPADDGTFVYADERLQALADYLTRAELTQCAHRNRPLRHDGRVVVTFCNQEIDFLPATTEVTRLPRGLDERGVPHAGARRDEERRRRTDAAYERLQQERRYVGERELARAAGVSRKYAGRYLQEKRRKVA